MVGVQSCQTRTPRLRETTVEMLCGFQTENRTHVECQAVWWGPKWPLGPSAGCPCKCPHQGVFREEPGGKQHIQFQAARFGPSVARPAPSRSSPQGPSLDGRLGITAGLKPQPRSPPTPTSRIDSWVLGEKALPKECLGGWGLPETVPWPGRPQRQVVACGRSGHLCGLGPRRISCDCYPSAACSARGCCGPACSTSGSSRGSYSSTASCFWFASAAIKCVVLRGACFRPSEPVYRQATPFELDARGRGEGVLHFVFAAWQSRGLAASLSKRDTAVSPPSLRT